MAEELRGTQFYNNATTDVSGSSILSNTADRDMYIRHVGHHATAISTAAETDMRMHTQIGKNNAISTTDGDTGVKCQSLIGQNGVTSGQFAKDIADTWYFAKGQLVLEPGETLYLNNNTTGTFDTVEQMIDVWYHY